MPRSAAAAPLAAVLLFVTSATPVLAQLPSGSVVTRTPNTFTTWVPDVGTVQFNFLHRFTESGPPEHQISNSPTFFIAAGLPGRTTAGFAYATSSDVAPGRPNEWEFFGRVSPLRPGNPFADVTLHLGRNIGANSTDGEVALARGVGPVRVLGAVRGFSNAFRAGDSRTALVGGLNIRLLRWLAVAGDMSSFNERRADERIAWSGGLQFGVPTTPHSFTIQATNANTGTLQGSSRGTQHTRWGFEYTVPITLSRYIPALRPKSPPETVAQGADSTLAATTTTDTTVARATATDSVRRSETPVVRDSAVVRDTTAPVTAATPTPTPTPTPTAAAPTPAPAPTRTPPVAAAPRSTPRATAAPRAGSGDTLQVRMKSLQYMPARLEVRAGGTITWRNDDPLPHSVVSEDGRFDSGLIQPGKRWSHTFTRAGTYTLHCTPHPFMKSVVVVK